MLPLYIAKRLFFRSDNSKRVSRPAIQIATAGVAIGVTVMIISVCIVMGFHTEIREKIFGLGSHIQVVNYESGANSESLPIVIDSAVIQRLSSVEGVRHVQRFCQKTGMLKTDDAFRGVAFRGVGQEYDTAFLANHLTDGTLPDFSDSISSEGIVISSNLAKQMKLKVGDRVYAYFFEKNVRARRFYVKGVYCTNLSDLDNRLIFADIYTVHQLCGWNDDEYSGVEILLTDFSELDDVSARIVDSVNHTQDIYGHYYTSPTIKEIYPSMFSWLDLLDTDVWVILVLMICVAGFTMISGLLIIILERTNFIGVMKALGSTNALLRHTFLYFAGLIILRGLIIGNIIAFFLIIIQNTTGVIRLDPQNYYMDRVPLLVNWSYIFLINVCTLIVSVLALIIPSLLISNIRPAKSIRFE